VQRRRSGQAITPAGTVTRKQKMGIKEWFRNWLLKDNDDEKYADEIKIREGIEADVDGLRFTVMPARGGTIVQMRVYDRHKDENLTATYVIPDGEDIAKEIGDIVSMELLRH
jgi:hypothetical protein